MVKYNFHTTKLLTSELNIFKCFFIGSIFFTSAAFLQYLQALNNALEDSWKDLLKLSFLEQGREINTQFASLVDGSELVIICSFVVQLPSSEADTIDIVYPLQTLKPIAAQLRSRVQADATDDDETWREKMEKAVLNVPLNLTALLSEPIVSVNKIKKLSIGDIIPIQVKDGITIKIKENPIFAGDMGELAGKSAINIRKKY